MCHWALDWRLIRLCCEPIDGKWKEVDRLREEELYSDCGIVPILHHYRCKVYTWQPDDVVTPVLMPSRADP